MTHATLIESLPHNPEAEQGLLGALLVDNRAYERVCDFLKAEHFYTPVHARIYSAFQTMLASGSNCSPVTLKKYFEKDADLADVGEGDYIAQLAGSTVTVFNVPEYASDIVDLYRRRETITICEEAISKAKNPEPDVPALSIISQIEGGLYGIAQTNGGGHDTVDFSANIAKAIANADAAYRGDQKARGISTGLIDLDGKIGGLRRSDLIILAGRPGSGKTSLVTGLSQAAAEKGYAVAFFSLEMSAEQLAERLMSAKSGVSVDLIRKQKATPSQFRKFITDSQSLAALPLFIADKPARTIAQIRIETRRLKRKHDIGLIVVDYLQLIGTEGKKNNTRVNDVTEITGGLKGLAKEFDVPVIALSQLNRGVEQREDKRPLMSDLRESGSIEQDADIIGMLYREEYYLDQEEPTKRAGEDDSAFAGRFEEWGLRKAAAKNRAEIGIVKNRHGPTGTVLAHFDGPTTTFSNWAGEQR